MGRLFAVVPDWEPEGTAEVELAPWLLLLLPLSPSPPRPRFAPPLPGGLESLTRSWLLESPNKLDICFQGILCRGVQQSKTRHHGFASSSRGSKSAHDTENARMKIDTNPAKISYLLDRALANDAGVRSATLSEQQLRARDNTSRRDAHHSKVVLRGHDPPIFAAGSKTKSSYDVLLAHSGKLEIDRGSVLQHRVAAES